MDNQENREKIIWIIKRLDIQREFKDIIINNIDILDLKELVWVIRKYTENLANIREKNDKIKDELNKQINKYKNTYDEYSEEIEKLDELESLIDNI